jgi:hypothetical protein
MTLSQQLDEFQRNRRTVWYIGYTMVRGGNYLAGPFATEADAREYEQHLLSFDRELQVQFTNVHARRV